MGKGQPSKKKGVNPKFDRTPRKLTDPISFDDTNFKWRVHNNYIDYDHEEWGWGKVTIQEFFKELLNRLQDYETMTWNEVLRRDSCHDMEASKLSPAAQRRLLQILPDIDTLHQLDMKQPCRLWGYRDRQILYLIWHDPKHTIYPV